MMKFMFRALVSTPTFCDPWCRTSYMFFLDHEHPERRDWRTTCAWPENFLPLKLWMFWDKYDAGYQFRGHLVRNRQSSRRPAVLVPTAYVNVSRTGIAY